MKNMRAFLGCVALACAANPSLTLAQVVFQQQVQIAGNFPNLGESGPGASSVDEMLSLMYLRIDLMQRELKLADPQVVKLRMAADAATKDVFKNPEKYGIGKAKIAFQMGFGNLNGANPANDEALSDEDSEAKSKTDAAKGQNAPGEDGMMELPTTVPLSTILGHDIWKSSLSSVVTKEQQAQLDELWKSREAAKRSARIERELYALDQTLLLSQSQREQMAEVVGKKIDQEPMKQAIVFQAAPIVIPGNADLPVSLTVDEVAPILSKTQLSHFNRMQAERNNPMAALGPLGPMVQNAIGQAIPGGLQGLIGNMLGVTVEDKKGKPVVTKLSRGGAGEQSGLKVGDVMRSFNGKKIGTASDFEKLVTEAMANVGPPEFEIERDGKLKSLKLKKPDPAKMNLPPGVQFQIDGP